jgi:hypothetical protein
MPLTAKDTVKFAVGVGFAAIFFDAAIAHGLFWDNDPYWTYWITKTFLITTVFLFGTAFLGVGIVPGLILTAVHTAILEVYYQWLAPVGLPQEPEWLDFNHLWVTGVPAHFLAILAGYLLVLWLWKRNRPAEETIRRAETSVFALYGLVTAALIVIIDGLFTQLLLLQDFPGITFFVQHLLIAFVFVCAWTAYAGLSASGWVMGSFLLALVWVSYNMYLGPRGLPLEAPTYSGYEDLWLRAFPGAFVSALLGWGLSSNFVRRRRLGFATIAAILVLAFPIDDVIAQTLPVEKGTTGLKATASAFGEGIRVTGPNPVDMKSSKPMTGTIKVETVEMGNRWSHVQNTDALKVRADFSSGDTKYEVTIDKPMPRHPLGQYTTWSGVVYDHDMHGDTGIGTGKLPKMRPDIALWGWAEVKRNDEIIAKMAPAHVMVTSKGAMPGIMLEIDTEQKTLAAEPDGYINVMWHKIDKLEMPSSATWTRLIIGWVALVGIVLLLGWLAYSEPSPPRTRE